MMNVATLKVKYDIVPHRPMYSSYNNSTIHVKILYKLTQNRLISSKMSTPWKPSSAVIRAPSRYCNGQYGLTKNCTEF